MQRLFCRRQPADTGQRRLTTGLITRALGMSCALLLCLSGCGGKDYALPERAAMGLDAPQAVLAAYDVDQAWWKLFDDPQLNTLVETALARNADLALSAINVNRALYRAGLLGADLVPAFSADGSAGSTTSTKSGDASRSYSAGLTVSYELDLWQRLRDTASAQAWEYRATEQDRESARLALIGNVIDGYYQLLYLRQSRALTAEMLAFYQKIHTLAEARFRAGSVDGLEPVSARQALLTARNNLTSLDIQIRTAEQTLRDLLNLAPDAPLVVAETDLLTVTVPEADLNVPLSALALRPDVRAAEYRVLSAFRSQEAERAGLWPSVTVGGSLNVSSDRADTLFDVPLLGGTVRVNLPFLQWNRVRWNIRLSEADFEAAKLDFIQTVTTALNEVDAACFAWRQTLTLLDSSLEKHRADKEASAYREQRYKAGVDELQDWLEARNTETASLLSALQTQYDAIRYASTIFRAMGGRLTSRQVPAQTPASPRPEG